MVRGVSKIFSWPLDLDRLESKGVGVVSTRRAPISFLHVKSQVTEAEENITTYFFQISLVTLYLLPDLK